MRKRFLAMGPGLFLGIVVSLSGMIPGRCLAAGPDVQPQAGPNYPGRRAISLDVSPYLMITGFSFQNLDWREGGKQTEGHSFRFQWTNTGTQPIVAFEVVTLLYDPFNEPLPGRRWIVGGHNRENFSPLVPGESSQETITGPGHVQAYTAIAYVRTVRLSDGRIWRVDDSVLTRELRRRAPNPDNLGPLVPKIDTGD